MNEEKQMILEMLKEGKINVEEASELLEAVGSDKRNDEAGFIDKLSSSLEKVIKKTSETISNIDFDSMTNPNNIYHINSVSVENETKIEDEVKEIDVNLINGDVKIERAQDNFILVKEKVYFKEKTEEVSDYLLIDVEEGVLSIKVNPEYKNYHASANLKIALGSNIYDELNLNSVNGEVEVGGVDFKETFLESVNGRISLGNTAGDVSIKNVNGKIEIKNTNGSLDVDNVNGSVNLSNVSGPEANVSAVNGSVRVDGINSKELSVNSQSGSIRVGKLLGISEISLNSGFGTLIVDTEDYDGDISAIIKSTNHSISEKFKNKIQRKEGYQISTDPEKTDLSMDLKSGFGKIIVK
ncbi:MAG: DUF4097 family beta strand repeat-containing protein [Anaerococcus sp.]|uniref:DUF4097 family beta strand repeat-containing protein n=1 Tax=Anaerococcus sp. TaxID=1872515 RepID=UPI002A77FB77|nr:DUF4097 family beta strand repeat-containing protein [Anaerococcus sp.]MDD7463586.1 DUF4097 family beta strand repeat-containing protein [Peptoniphilaceae bacterium]MDY3055348.1 DUF4097 family beta strand repeat-containing protein [Anaerococcus sp.]MDY6126814.1 DUF4097 family beta strand repeat-containing protein [Anaerococcus sp.]